MLSYLSRFAVMLALAALGAECGKGQAEAAGPRPQPRLGINLSAPKDYNTELPFVDVFRTSRPWASRQRGGSWGAGPPLALDSHGWVTRLQPGYFAEAGMCNIRGGHYPSGNYTVLYDGEGEIDVAGDAVVVSKVPGSLQIRVTPARGFQLRILATTPGNYVRNIRVIMPGFVNTYQTNPWNPQFLQRWQGAACLRFMDFMQTNSSTISSWGDRPQLSDATFFTKGVPLELLVDLANRLNADPWFCIPHQVGDYYVRMFATYVKNNLKPGLKAYVQYSNETWNCVFGQCAHATQMGLQMGLSRNPGEAAAYYTSLRSVQIFNIWQNVLGGPQRLVRVLPSQASSSWVSGKIASFGNAYQHADVLAIAPYITCNVGSPSGPSAAAAPTWSLDQLFRYLRAQSLPKSIVWMQETKKVADKYGLKLVAYEGGQSLVGVGAAVNDDAITALLQAANADPRMGALYGDYYQAWQQAGGDLFNHFNSVEQWTKYGSWGILQFQDDDPAKSPKYAATIQWARSLGQNIKVP